MIENAVISAVYHDGTLTIATRMGARINMEDQQLRATVAAAAVRVLQVCARHRHDLPVLYLAGDGAAELQAAILNATPDAARTLPSSVIDWFGESSQPKYKNKGSEIVDAFAVRPAKYKPPRNAPGLGVELAAFRRDESNGVIVYPSPETAAVELDRFPALALALLLAVQPARELAVDHSYGHAPYQAIGSYGHSPVQPFGHDLW